MSTKKNSLNPFPGLRPFRQDEDYLFFGREEQTMELLQRLGTHRFVAVVGTSGSGKSSLVRCGLLSELLGGKLLRAGASWEVAVTQPGGNPLALLTEAILDADIYDRDEEHAREQLLATLSRSQFGLVEAVKQARLGEGTNFLLVVDQFEEIFRFNEAGQAQQEVANEFVSLLLEAAEQTEVPIYIVLTMRSDFIGDCGQFEGLAEMVNRGEFLIPRLSRDQYKRVIEAPIKVAGGQITPRLLQRLLNDLGQQADQLPCLQHALMRTWSVWSERGDTDALDLDDYQRVGRMSEALSLHADEIFDSLESDRQRELCAGMFKALTVQESENRGIRRPQRMGSLCQILEVSAAELRPVIEAFRRQNVTFLMPPAEVELTEKTIIDISHESLMRVWTRLRRWVDEEAQAVGIYRRLSESAALHEQSKAGLYRDPELGIALSWRKANRPNQAWAERYSHGFLQAMAFLDASQQAQLAEEQGHEAARQRELEQARILASAERARAEVETRSARRLRVLLAGAAVIAVIAVGASLVAVKFWSDADIAKRTAELSEESARQNAATAKSEAERATIQEAAAKTQAAAAKTARGEAEENLARARGAIDEYMTKVSESQLLSTPGLQPLRADLLASASQFYEDILKKDPNNPDLQAGLAAAFYRVGFVRFDTGDRDESAKSMERAAQFYTSALALQPANAELKHGLASSWFMLSAINMLNGDSTRSNEYGKRAAQIWEELILGSGKDLRYQKELARAYNLIGINYSNVRRPEEAFLAYRKSLSIRLSLISDHPDDVQLIHGLAESFNNLSSQVADSKLRMQMVLRGIAHAERAHQLRPQVVEYALDLSGFYLSAAIVSASEGRGSEARDLARRNFNHVAQFIRANPSVPDMRRLLPPAIALLGRSPDANAETQAALIRECAKTAAALPKETPEDHYVDAEAQATCMNVVWRAGLLGGYSAAAVKDRNELREQGIKALEAAVKAGFSDAEQMAQDPSLASLRSHPQFSKLLAQVTEAGAKVAGAAPPAKGERIAGGSELAQFNQDRATGYQAFGVIESSLKRTEQAAKSYDLAMTLRRSLAESAPEDKQIQDDLAGMRDALASLFWDTGRLKTAREMFQLRIKDLEQKVQGDSGDPAAGTVNPAQAAAIINLAATEREFADSLAGRGLWEEATPHYVQSLKWSSQLKLSQPNQEYQDIVAPILWLLESTDQSYSAACERALAKYPLGSNPEYAARVARLCALSPKAVADLVPVLTLTDKAQYSWLSYARGLVLYRLGRFEEALSTINAARQKQEIGGMGMEDFVLAMAHFQAGRQEQARTILAAANQRTPRMMASWTHSPHNMLDVDWLVLREEANQLIHGSPYGLDDRRRRGQAYALLGDFAKAEAELSAVIAALPDDPPSRFAFARAQWELGRKAEAAQAVDRAEQALKLNWSTWAGDVELWRDCAETYRILHRPENAVKAIRRAVAAQTLTVIMAPKKDTERWLLRQLNDELIRSLQAAGQVAEATAARRELELLHAAFGLPPIIDSASDLLADAGLGNKVSGTALAAVDSVITARLKSTADSDPVRDQLLGRLHQRRATILQDEGRSEQEVQEAISSARGQYEQLLVADPNNAFAAGGLADLMLMRSAWTVLQPTEMIAPGGEKLTVEKDGSIFVSGPNPDRAVYNLKLRTDLPALTAIRLEALPDARLPQGGAGRFPGNGNFHLAELSAAIVSGKKDAKPTRIDITSAMADAQDRNSQFNSAKIIDGNPKTFWDTFPAHRQSHWVVFGLRTPVKTNGSHLSVRLDKGITPYGQHGLGRFRLSATDAPGAYQSEEQRLAAQQLTSPWAKLGFAYSQNGLTAKAADAFAKGLDQATSPSDRNTIIQWVAKHEGAVEALVKLRPKDPLLQVEMATLHAARGEHQLAASAQDKARTLFEQQLAAEPANASLAQAIADLLLQSSPSKWTVLNPTEMKSAGGAILTKLPDNSILASGPNPLGDFYSIVTESPGTGVRVIRLETLTHESLPNRGPGRDGQRDRGNFALTNWQVTTRPVGAPATPVELSQVVADYYQGELTTRNWNAGGGGSRPHMALFMTKQRIDGDQGAKLEFRMNFSNNAEWPGQNLGRFRISVSDDPLVFDRDKLRFAAMRLTDPWAKLGAAYVLAGETERAADLLAKLGETEGIASWLDSDFSFDSTFDLLKDKKPALYAKILSASASIATERGQVDQARSLYERLGNLQPENGLWQERSAQLQPNVLSAWNFDAGLGQWGDAKDCELSVKEGVLTAKTLLGNDPQFSTPCSSPAGAKAVVLRYRTDLAFIMQLFWADSAGGLSESRHLDFPIPASPGEWREITLPFFSQGTLKTLRLDPNTSGDHPLEIDSLVLRRLEPPEYASLLDELVIKPELARLTREIEADPMSAEKYQARATFQTQVGHWRESAADFAQGVKLNPQSRYGWFFVANSLVLAGDEEGYRQHCQAMLAQFKDASEADVVDSVCKTCCLRPGAVELGELPVKKLRDATTEPQWARYSDWFVACCALVSYREGKHEDAIDWAKKHANSKGHSAALALVVRAMAEQQLGQSDAARQTLADAEAMIPAELRTLGTEGYSGPLPVPPAVVAHDWLAPEILRREAAKLIADRKPRE